MKESQCFHNMLYVYCVRRHCTLYLSTGMVLYTGVSKQPARCANCRFPEHAALDDASRGGITWLISLTWSASTGRIWLLVSIIAARHMCDMISLIFISSTQRSLPRLIDLSQHTLRRRSHWLAPRHLEPSSCTFSSTGFKHQFLFLLLMFPQQYLFPATIYSMKPFQSLFHRVILSLNWFLSLFSSFVSFLPSFPFNHNGIIRYTLFFHGSNTTDPQFTFLLS